MTQAPRPSLNASNGRLFRMPRVVTAETDDLDGKFFGRFRQIRRLLSIAGPSNAVSNVQPVQEGRDFARLDREIDVLRHIARALVARPSRRPVSTGATLLSKNAKEPPQRDRHVPHSGWVRVSDNVPDL